MFWVRRLYRSGVNLTTLDHSISVKHEAFCTTLCSHHLLRSILPDLLYFLVHYHSSSQFVSIRSLEKGGYDWNGHISFFGGLEIDKLGIMGRSMSESFINTLWSAERRSSRTN